MSCAVFCGPSGAPLPRLEMRLVCGGSLTSRHTNPLSLHCGPSGAPLARLDAPTARGFQALLTSPRSPISPISIPTHIPRIHGSGALPSTAATEGDQARFLAAMLQVRPYLSPI